MRQNYSSQRFSIPHRLLLCLCITASAPFVAAVTPPDGPLRPASQTQSEQLLTALRRDIGLESRQVSRYLEMERQAMVRSPQAQRTLGARFGGAWLERGNDGNFRFVIAVTHADAEIQARALGAQVRIVKRSLNQLDSEKSRLDAASKMRRQNPGIHVWYVDAITNQVVIEADASARNAAMGFATLSGIDPAAVRVVESVGAPQTLTIVGGERYNVGSSWCSIGIPVTRGSDTGFATAGHCGGVGTTTAGTNGVAQGVVSGSIFPGADMAWVQITNSSAWPLSNSVTNYAGSAIPIVGSTSAPLGAVICRSGAKTGYRCGQVFSNNVTVNYPSGAVYGLTTTSACSGKGDSGGAYITPSGQAQGVASGGSSISSSTGHNCDSRTPRSHYQPLNPLMSQFGLALFTGSQQSLPIITNFNCPRNGDTGEGFYVCAVQYTSPTPASVEWIGEVGESYTTQGYSEFYGSCSEFEQLEITAIVTNSFGSSSTPMQTFLCRMGPLP